MTVRRGSADETCTLRRNCRGMKTMGRERIAAAPRKERTYDFLADRRVCTLWKLISDHWNAIRNHRVRVTVVSPRRDLDWLLSNRSREFIIERCSPFHRFWYVFYPRFNRRLSEWDVTEFNDTPVGVSAECWFHDIVVSPRFASEIFCGTGRGLFNWMELETEWRSK